MSGDAVMFMVILLQAPFSEKVTLFSARSVVDAKPLAIDLNFLSRGHPVLTTLLLLLLLLIRFQHSPFGEPDRLAQHIEIADVIGKNENQRSVEIGALRLVEPAMRFDDQPIGGIRKIRFG
jgi:hypothetical protein